MCVELMGKVLITATVSIVAAVASLGATGMNALEAFVKGHIPGIHLSTIPALPVKARVPPPKPAAPVAKSAPAVAPVATGSAVKSASKASKAKSAIGFFGKKFAFIGGVAASGDVVPLQMNGSSDCYQETPNGNVHMPCDSLKH